MKNLTENEAAVLNAFFESEYGDVDMAAYTEYGREVWMFSIKEHSRLDGKTFSGTVSSLVKKGLVITDTAGDKGAMQMSIKDTYIVTITEKGWHEYESYFTELCIFISK